MGAISKAATPASPERMGFKELLDKSWDRIAGVMPRHMSPERMYQMALSAYNTTPHLADCSPSSVMSCLMKCSALGMEPSAVDGLGRIYVLPYKNGRTGGYEAQVIIGYKGMIELARRSGQLSDISARCVHEGDEFEWEFGLDERLRHVPSPEPVEGRALTHVYVVAHFKDGGHYVDVMSKAEVDAVRKRSKASERGPWVTDYEAMARKTVVRRAFPFLPVSIEVQADVTSDGSTPRFVDSQGEIFGLPEPQADEPAEPIVEDAEGDTDAE